MGDHLPLALLTGVYVGGGLLIQAFTELDVTRELEWGSLLVGLGLGSLAVTFLVGCLLFVFLLTWTTRRLTRRAGRPSPFRSRWSDYRCHLSAERLAGVFLVGFLYVPLMNTFVGIKGEIPAIHPFAWDEPFMRLDRMLHLGHDPWRILQPLVGTPTLTSALDALYYVWFPVNLIMLLGMAWSPRSPLRGQFFLAFFALWILLGTLMAIAFSSAGPCYYGLVVAGPDPYAPLMEYLRQVDAMRPLTALDVQAILWAGYTGTGQLVEGIAAMPSLHVAVPVLYAIAGWRIDRRLGILFGVYAFVILLGSVHLAWHYAVDGYVTFLLVPLIWWGAGRVYRAWQNSETNREPY